MDVLQKPLVLTNGSITDQTLADFVIDKPDVKQAIVQNDTHYVDRVLLMFGYRPVFAPHSPFSK